VDMKIRFYGARGSHPTAVPIDRIEKIQKNIWDLARKSSAKTWSQFQKEIKTKPHSFASTYSCHTTCIEILSEGSPMPIYVDMGTGLSAAAGDLASGLNNDKFKADSGEAAFFITHTHWDHIIGLPTLYRLYKPGNEFHFYGAHKGLKKRIAGLFNKNYFPVEFDLLEDRLHFHELRKDEQIPFGKLKISTASQPHPGTSFAYRFEYNHKIFVIATDTDLSNTMASSFPKGKNIYSGATMVAVDSHFTHEDYLQRKTHGHPSIERVVDFAASEEINNIMLTHHNPAYDDEFLDALLESAYTYLRSKYGERHPLRFQLPIEGNQFNL